MHSVKNEMDVENCKNAAQIPFMQPKNTTLVADQIAREKHTLFLHKNSSRGRSKLRLHEVGDGGGSENTGECRLEEVRWHMGGRALSLPPVLWQVSSPPQSNWHPLQGKSHRWRFYPAASSNAPLFIITRALITVCCHMESHIHNVKKFRQNHEHIRLHES